MNVKWHMEDNCSVKVKECPTKGATFWKPNNRLVDMVFVICLDPEACWKGALVRSILRENLPVSVVQAIRLNKTTSPVLTPGEVSLRLSNLKVFQRALDERLGSILVLVRAAGTNCHLRVVWERNIESDKKSRTIENMCSISIQEEDAIILHDQFSLKLSEVLACPRCGCPLVKGSGVSRDTFSLSHTQAEAHKIIRTSCSDSFSGALNPPTPRPHSL